MAAIISNIAALFRSPRVFSRKDVKLHGIHYVTTTYTDLSDGYSSYLSYFDAAECLSKLKGVEILVAIDQKMPSKGLQMTAASRFYWRQSFVPLGYNTLNDIDHQITIIETRDTALILLIIEVKPGDYVEDRIVELLRPFNLTTISKKFNVYDLVKLHDRIHQDTLGIAYPRE